MQKLGFPAMKSLDQLRSLSGSVKSFSFSSRPSSSSSTDSITSGSFANLKITAEKLVKEQASVKTDLEMANNKLKKATGHIRALEEKLQNAFNENAKLKVKQKEDEKLWRGLESKFSSTKTLCDQLTETLQQLAGQVQDAEKDKEYFEGKISASSTAIEDLNQQLNGLSLKLGSAETTVRNREKELEELKIQKEDSDMLYKEEQRRTANLILEKDAMLKKFEENIAANRLATENLKSKLEELQNNLRLKENEIRRLMSAKECLEKEKSDLQFNNNDLASKLAMSLQEIKNLEAFVHVLAAQLAELDKQSLTFTDKFDQLNSVHETSFKLVQQERDLASQHAQRQYEQLHEKFLCATSEKETLQVVNQELNGKIIELREAHKSIMAQLQEECHSAGERIQRLETEAEMLMSKKNETEILVSKLEETIKALSASSKASESKMQNLFSKISALEMENKENAEKLQTEMQKKTAEIDTLQKESEKQEQQVDSLEKQVGQLHSILKEKEQLILQYKEGLKKLEDQFSENLALLMAAESKLTETKKQYDVMLESKQLELSRHLKEISLRNDQAIDEIRQKYEVEKLEIVNMEKAKADKLVSEMERNCKSRLAECEEESRQQLVRIQDEHAALVLHIQQERERKEMNLKADHSEELKRAELQAENDLRERTMQLRNEYDAQIKALKFEQEDEVRKLQEELDLQKSKEERQRALLQLQWKVMGDKPQDDAEANSKRDYSVSSIKMRDPGGGKRSKHAEVTHREYEVEMNNGRTITKRRKTKSAVIFEDPSKHKKLATPKARTPKVRTPGSVVKGVKGSSYPSNNIGDLFTEGSLNPYADDPYAFD